MGRGEATTRARFSAASPGRRGQQLKPPRSVPPPTPAVRPNGVTKAGNSNKMAVAAAATCRTLPKPAPPPIPTGDDKPTPKGNEEAASLCQGRFRAAVANLKAPEGHRTTIATTVTATSIPMGGRPSKPPRGTLSPARPTIETNGSSRSTHSKAPPPTTLTPGVTRGQGHVKHLIDHFQNN